MRKNNTALLISGAAALAACVVVYVFDARLARGLAAGYFTGLLNYFLIATSVKRILAAPGAPAAKTAAGVFLYLMRLLLAAAIIAAVIMAAKLYSVLGFLTGFTLCVAAVIVAHKIYGLKN